MSRVPHDSSIGFIMYDMICTHPDVSYALSMMSRYQANLGEGHWTAMKGIPKYIRRTKDTFLVFDGNRELVINGYVDASFMTARYDMRSQFWYVFCLNGNVVS